MTELQQIWRPSQAEFDSFARISGDNNPIQVDPDFSARVGFGRTVAHGMLIYTKLWGMVCATRPGAGAMRQSMMFPNPAFAGEDVHLVITGDFARDGVDAGPARSRRFPTVLRRS